MEIGFAAMLATRTAQEVLDLDNLDKSISAVSTALEVVQYAFQTNDSHRIWRCRNSLFQALSQLTSARYKLDCNENVTIEIESEFASSCKSVTEAVRHIEQYCALG